MKTCKWAKWHQLELFSAPHNTQKNSYIHIHCTQNIVYVTCMLHAKRRRKHVSCYMHVVIRLHMHVSCNMQGFGTLSMHNPLIECHYSLWYSILHMHVHMHVSYMCFTYMLHVCNIQQALFKYFTCIQHHYTMHV